jgi:hypothetical protein
MTDGKQPFSDFLDSAGNGTGTKNMATTADIYYLEAQAGQSLVVERLIISYQDAGGGTVDEYGNLNAALSTGIEIKVVDPGGTIVDLTDGVPVQQNGHWARFCYDAQRLDWGAGEDLFVVRWTFAKAGRPVFLNPGDRLEFQVNDDLTLLSNHYALAQGYVYAS